MKYSLFIAMSFTLLTVLTSVSAMADLPPPPPPSQPESPANIQAPAPIDASVKTQSLRVGDLYNTDNYNLRFYPFDLVLGGMRGDLLNRGDGSWAIGPTVQTINSDLGFFREKYWGAGITSTYSFGRPAFSHGWYLSPEAVYRSGQVAVNDIFSTVNADFHMFSMALTAGYHWYWKSFNLAMGLGGAYNYVQVSNVKGTIHDFFGVSGDSTQNGDSFSASAFGVTADFIMGFTF